MSDTEKRKRGPKPQRANTDDDFDTVIKRALKKKPLKSVGTEPTEGDSDPEGGEKSEK